MTKIISIANQKGGVGKTTTSVNLAAGLSFKGKRVLCIDLDPQANLTQSLGIKDFECSIYDSLTQNSDLVPIEKRYGFEIVPSHINLSGAEVELINEPGREYILKNLINKIKANYDFIFIDCPPSLGLLTVNAFVASDRIIIPLQAEFLATQGLAKIMEIITKVKERINPEFELGGVILTQFNSRKVLNKDIKRSIEQHFSDKLFDTTIRENISLAEAPAAGLDIFEYNDKCIGADDYEKLTDEFLLRFS
ncbi:MAG: AAA family ATPase [Bacteroidales bacterium]|jgi:chromosome partitioning protein|nr:AAA family ATPase [Bacteroidales bacterium]